MGIRQFRPMTPSRRASPKSRCSSRCGGRAGATTRATSPTGGRAAGTSVAIDGSTSGAKSSAFSRRWRRWSTTPTGHRASRCCTTRMARSATSWPPRALRWATLWSRGRARTSGWGTRCRCSRSPSAPRCTTWSSRSGEAASWPVPRAPASRWSRRKATTSRSGCAPPKCGWYAVSASPRSARWAIPSTSCSRSGRPARAAGWAGIRGCAAWR